MSGECVEDHEFAPERQRVGRTDAFKTVLGRAERSIMNELVTVCNKLSHVGSSVPSNPMGEIFGHGYGDVFHVHEIGKHDSPVNVRLRLPVGQVEDMCYV